MIRAVRWIWKHGVISTFLSGWFAILPIVLTIMIVIWVADQLGAFLGPESLIGGALERVGGRLLPDSAGGLLATALGWVIVLAGIWALGVLIKSTAKHRVQRFLKSMMDRIPIVSSLYSTAAQLVGMLQKDDDSDLKAMRAVYCSFGREHGVGFLGLLTSAETYDFADQKCWIVYVPTSPVPMTGGLMFVPVDSCREIEMTAEQVMRVYLSLGILAAEVVPKEYRVTVDQG